MIRNILSALALFCCMGVSAQTAHDTSCITLPIGGNAWVSKGAKAVVGNSCLYNWKEKKDTVTFYIRPEAAGSLNIAVRLRVPSGKSKIKVLFNKRVFSRAVSNKDHAIISFGKVNIRQTGYVRIDLLGVFKTDSVFAQLSGLQLTGSALSKGAVYVKNNEGNYFYWGRRGPSVHLNYKTPANTDIEWFYNEITVPVGGDVQGSYFMANGFENGYFGMQVNSPTERRVLFSVWSPFTTDDPKSIPDSMKVGMLKKGANVHAGEFGDEGSGGQSYMLYPWKAGKTYAFLTHAKPNSANHSTVYTCYFKGDDGQWQLMASFQRPKTFSYLKRLHSFLENFDPEFGNNQRKANYGNAWIVDTTGKWTELTEALFTGDATAKKGYRKDHCGGTEGATFYLRNCGFFNDLTPLNTTLNRAPGGRAHPFIEFDKLP